MHTGRTQFDGDFNLVSEFFSWAAFSPTAKPVEFARNSLTVFERKLTTAK